MAYYMDLFDGDPATRGVSVLSAITGSSTRPDVTSALTQTTAGFYPFQTLRLTNTDTVTVTTSSESTANVSFVALYDADHGGNLVVSIPLGASPTICKGNPVQFRALGLTFVTFAQEMAIEMGTGIVMITETDIPMVVQ